MLGSGSTGEVLTVARMSDDEVVPADVLGRFDEAGLIELNELAYVAGVVARQTFGPFNDAEDSPYFKAAGESPESTWEGLAERVALATGRAVAWGLADVDASPARIAELHRLVFGRMFPDSAGQIRGDGEDVTYGIVIGSHEHLSAKRQRGTGGGKQLARRLDAACSEFNESVAFEDAQDESELTDLLLIAVRFYAKVLSAHPFCDGNGRTAYALLQYALVRVGLLAVALDDFESHQRALGWALRSDGRQTYDPLVELLADKIGSSRVVD
jgi:fido (protein-threonine AMPylation protein)